ncbi:MAG: hypothetical protein IJ660_03910 [Alphaproteobacteria bacterium]|nr:hypothetical protein [Alphaproteobacteria bacterium]
MFKSRHIRILPIFIFLSSLLLTIRVTNIIESLRHNEFPKFGIGEIQAAETVTPEAAALSSTLQSSDLKDKAQNSSKTENSSSEDNEDSNKTSFTPAEVLILQELAERREALDLRSAEIDKKALQLKVSEREIDKQLKQLQEYEQKLKTLIQEYNAKEKEKIASLVKVYTSMKPKDAARIFETLDLEVTVALLKEMKPSASSAILAQITPAKAKAITDKIIGNAF